MLQYLQLQCSEVFKIHFCVSRDISLISNLIRRQITLKKTVKQILSKTGVLYPYLIRREFRHAIKLSRSTW